jgi:hypothetical protein
MQSLEFVFAGLRDARLTDDVQILMDRLNQNFAKQQLFVAFSRKEELLMSEFEDVSFFVSLFSNKRDLKDWFQMAKDFELTADPNPIDYKSLGKRYQQKKTTSPELYKEVHYLIGQTIFWEMSTFAPIEIYFFQ